MSGRSWVATHFVVCMLLLMVCAAVPRGPFVLVLVSPSESPEAVMDVVTKAGGAFVAPGRFPWMAVAYSENPGFPARLMASGALVVLNHALAVGCQQKVSI